MVIKKLYQSKQANTSCSTTPNLDNAQNVFNRGEDFDVEALIALL